MTSAVPPKLSELLSGLAVWLPSQDPAIRGVVFDSRRVRPGDLYVALPGTKSHGGAFASAARAAGAVALLTDAEGARLAGDVPLPVAYALMLGSVVVLTTLSLWLLRRGVGLRS